MSWMCNFDILWGWAVEKTLEEKRKPAPRTDTYDAMVECLQDEIDYASSRGTNIINLAGLEGNYGDVEFIERLWTQTWIFLEKTADPVVFKYHRVEKET